MPQSGKENNTARKMLTRDSFAAAGGGSTWLAPGLLTGTSAVARGEIPKMPGIPPPGEEDTRQHHTFFLQALSVPYHSSSIWNQGSACIERPIARQSPLVPAHPSEMTDNRESGKSNRACQWLGWGQLSVDGPGHYNPA
jgi:hypothetical protein